jgi:hypothetical protein
MGPLLTIVCLFVIPFVGRASSPEAGQTPTSSQLPAATSQAYVFPSGAGMLFFYVRPDRTAEFESVLARLNEALEAAPDSVRKQQAAGWRIFKSVEATRDAAIYVFAFDPAAAGADYDPVKVLAEALPSEAQAFYEKLKSAIIRVERMGLHKLR